MLTPDQETGIGRWREREIVRNLRTGNRPDGGLAQSLMAGLVLFSTSHLIPDEARAVAAYLKRVPPVRRRPAATADPYRNTRRRRWERKPPAYGS
jgi:hypothetical protein